MAEAPKTGPTRRRGFWISLRWRFTGWLTLITAGVMAVVVTQVRGQIQTTLEEQIQARGLAMARNLAGSCVEPMQLGESLNLMLLVREYVQTGGGEEARRRLEQRAELWPLVRQSFEDLIHLKGAAVEGVRNEGVVAVLVVDQAGTIAAYADAATDPMEWLDEINRPYQPYPGTGVLGPAEGSHVWMSRARNGIFLIGVPVEGRAAAPAEGEAAAGDEAGEGEPGAAALAGPVRLGTVFLAVSQGLILRTVARAVAYLLLVSLGLLLTGAVVALIISSKLTKPIRMLQTGVQAITAGDFNRQIPLKRADELGELTDAFNDMAKGLAERETMRGAFSSYVSADLLAEIIRNPEIMKPGGTRKTATVMFTFFGIHEELASMAEKVEAEEIVRIINEYLEVEARMVAEFKGYPDKFIGDALVAVWGVPMETPDHAEQAVRCAVGIQRAVADLNELRRREGKPVTDISIGVNTGSLVVGSMGSEGAKLDYTVIGENVNFAARLAGAGATIHGGSIWIGESTYALVKDLVVSKDLGRVEFKGLGARPVFEVTDVREHEPAAAR